jgi:hypothetical protein
MSRQREFGRCGILQDALDRRPMRLVHVWPIGMAEIRRDLAQALRATRLDPKTARNARSFLRVAVRVAIEGDIPATFLHDNEEGWRILRLMHKG